MTCRHSSLIGSRCEVGGTGVDDDGYCICEDDTYPQDSCDLYESDEEEEED
jgi:hypothetical protein